MAVWSEEDRRRRLVSRHHLAPVTHGQSLPAVCRDLVGLHATDPVSVYLQARARLDDVASTDVEQALYDDRVVARFLAMRRTMFVIDPDDLPMLRAAVTDRLGARELARTAKWIEDADIADDGAAWVRRAAHDTVAALAEHGPMTALQLRRIVPQLAEQIVVNRGKKYESKMGMSTRVLFWLATTGQVVRGRPGGSLSSTNWEWANTENWLGRGALPPADPHESAVALARRYFQAFGPATFDDLQWWTGWTKTLTRKALADLGPDEVEVADGAGGSVTALVNPGDDKPTADADLQDEPVVALLPALDATPMGWKERAWFLDGHTDFPGPLFDRNGNIGPTVWVNGRVVGGWGQRPDGEIAWRLLEDPAPADETAITREAQAVAEWLEDLRFTPRFPTPLQSELAKP